MAEQTTENSKKRRSIRTRFSTMTALAVIVSVVSIGLVSMFYIIRISNEYLEELLMLKCSSIEAGLDGRLNSIEQCVDAVAYYASNHMTGDSDEELEEYVNNVDRQFHTVVNKTDGIITYYFRLDPEFNKNVKGFWYFRDSSGTFEYAEPTDLQKYDHNDTTRTGWFYIPKEKGYATWLEPYNNDNLGGVKMISYVCPVFVKGKFIGVAGIDYDYETLRKQLSYKGHFKNAYTFLVNQNDKIIYHPDIESGESVDLVSYKIEGRNLSNNQMVQKIEFNGESQRVTWRVLANNMRLFLAVPEMSVRAYWFRFASAFAATAFLLLIICVTISTWMAGRLVKPLDNLTEAARKIDEGNYNVDLRYNRNDEIGVLTNTFKQLIGHLEAHITDLNDMAYKDALTSVKNKGAFDIYMGKLDERIAEAGMGDKPEFAICMFDCNGLKTINDTYGHDKGDIYLKRACRLICEVFAHSPVFRLGGDEFVSVLQNDDYSNRKILCALFDEQSIARSEMVTNPWEKIDIAKGIAIYAPDQDESVADVYRRADKRMYEDKGRKKAGIIRDMADDMVND